MDDKSIQRWRRSLKLLLTLAMVTNSLPAMALEEMVDGAEVEAQAVEIVDITLENDANDEGAMSVGVTAESEVSFEEQVSISKDETVSDEVALDRTEEPVVDVDEPQENVVAKEAATSEDAVSDTGDPAEVDTNAAAEGDDVAGLELTAQAGGGTQTITTKGFTLALPSNWAGKVDASTLTASGQNVGTMTHISMDGLLVSIHCARRSEFKSWTGWGDVYFVGRKTGEDYIVEVYMGDWWTYGDSTELTNAIVGMLTGGEYTSRGAKGSPSYDASLECAKQYVKSNVLNKLVLKKAPVTGKWVQSGSRWWYKLSDGTYPRSQFRTISGARYYFDASGWMVTGWRKISGAWYYFHPSGKMAKSTWIASGSDWYRIDSNGKMATGWRTVAKRRYWFAKSGVMATGWKRISNKWYYFERSGAMVKSRWVGNYYLQKDGTMATNKWIGKYHVNAKGVWDKTR